MTKMEAEMKMVFQQKVQEKKNKLMQSDADVRKFCLTLKFNKLYNNNIIMIFLINNK